ncbi:MAG: hypothetical protein HY811_07225 [Planctomycetes bacterium]|nr:hypothetical protein [Planctomycetota bacterium]
MRTKIDLIYVFMHRSLMMIVLIVMITGILFVQNVNVWGQSGKEETAKPEQEPVTKEIWYMITDSKGLQIGFGHTTWTSVTVKEAPAWKIVAEVAPTRTGINLPIQRKIKTIYIRQDNLSFIEATRQVGRDMEKDLVINAEEDKIVFKYLLTSNKTYVTEKPIPAGGIYDFECIGRLIKQPPDPTRNLTEGVSIIFEGRIASPLAELKVKLVGKITEIVMGKETEGHLVECQYTDAAIKPNTFKIIIDREGYIVKFTNDYMVMTMVSKEEARSKKRTVFDVNGRIDPFIPRHTPKGAKKAPYLDFLGDNKGEGPAGSDGNPGDDLEWLKKVDSAKDSLSKMEKMIADETMKPETKEKELSDKYLEIRAIYEALNKTDKTDFKQQMDEVVKRLEEIFPIKQLLYERAKDLRDNAAAILADIKKDLNAAIEKNLFGKLEEKLKTLKEYCAREEIKGTEYEQKIMELAIEVEGFNNRAKIINEFYTVKGIKIDGVLFYEKRDIVALKSPFKISIFGLRFNDVFAFTQETPVASVLINGNYYGENEKVEEGLIVKKITKDKKVIFSYKGEELVLK